MSSREITLCVGALLLAAAISTPFPPTWTARLDPTGNSTVRGTASVTAGMGDSSSAMISISGAKSGQYPWQVHSGKCSGSEGPIVGSSSAYPLLNVGSSGSAMATATIAFKPMAGSDYSVNVRRSKTDQAVIACGDLKASTAGMDSMSTRYAPDSARYPRDTTMPPMSRPDSAKPPAPPQR
jgi:hypothetical protein